MMTLLRSTVALQLSLGLLASGPAVAQQLDLTVPSEKFAYINQRKIASDACGPVSLLNSFGAGSERWRSVYKQVPGESDRARIASVVKTWGLQPSRKFPQRSRWQKQRGVSFEDLSVISAEMTRLSWKAPRTKSELFFLNQDGQEERLLRKTHQRLAKSFKKGLPPILSIRRFVFRDGYWQSVHGHFATLTAMPSKLSRGSRAFSVRYLEPLGAVEVTATIILPGPEERLFPCLILVAPDSQIGAREVKGGEATHLALAGAIGAW